MANTLDDADGQIPAGYDPFLYRLRHSAAHVLAQAVRERFSPDGPVRLAIGPPVEHGFYYDFDLPRPATDDDLRQLEQRMAEIATTDFPFAERTVTEDEARALLHDEPYKLELIDGLTGSGADHKNAPGREQPRITVYQHAGFVDLCRGPHLRSTGEIDPGGLKLLNAAGAYWRGDERRPMLQRIYGTAWPTKADLDRYLWQRAEAERRDHRRLGPALELFHLDPTAPGMPYWLPNGVKLLTEILAFWRTEHERRGYQEIAAPLVNARSLWETSGHWEHYKDEMFVIPVGEHAVYGLKPMNCPNAMVVYNLKTRSYRDLPLRLSDCDVLHRHERSGTLHGLLRAQEFRQDDAHIFVTEDQVEAEYDRILEIADLFYRVFGLAYRFRLGTRPDDFIGDLTTWDRAEAALRRILDKHVGEGNYLTAEGDGAFYGPKIDILMDDALGRSWQMGTIQLDFQLPLRFGCVYADRDGTQKTPVVIHRVIYGSLERFIGILIEHTEGAFPVWLAPVQARLVPIADAQVPFAVAVADRLRAAGLRVDVDDSRERMQAKIRAAQLQKIPYILVAGRREVESETVSVRLRTGEDLGPMPVDRFADLASSVVRSKSLGLMPPDES